MTAETCKWVLRKYERNGDKLLGEQELQEVVAADLRTIFGEPPDNPMYDCYPITAAQLQRVQEIVGNVLHLDQYEYFIECDDQDDVEQRQV